MSIRERGITLAIVLILLAVLSLLTGVSLRGASSNEQISNQSRLKNLAQQAAEAGLRYCETNVQLNALDGTKGFAPTAAPANTSTKYDWENLSQWDIAPEPAYLHKPASYYAVGDGSTGTGTGTGTGKVYFARVPECMSQYLTLNDTKVVLTTARGLGPDVRTSKDANATPPEGTEVWLQSVITMK
jgi:type IV pilus assembly protein PilX